MTHYRTVIPLKLTERYSYTVTQRLLRSSECIRSTTYDNSKTAKIAKNLGIKTTKYVGITIILKIILGFI